MDRSLRSLAPPVSGRLGALTTARLELRPINSDSVDLLAPVFAKEEVWRFPFGRGLAVPTKETRQFLDGALGDPRVRIVAGHRRRPASTIGYAGLSVPTFLPEVLPAVEVGWRLDPLAWGFGYAAEAAEAALGGAFGALCLEEVISLPQVDNPPSVRVAERIGMRLHRTATVPPTDTRGPVEVAVMVMTNQNGVPRAAPPASDSSRFVSITGSAAGSRYDVSPLPTGRPWVDGDLPGKQNS